MPPALAVTGRVWGSLVSEGTGDRNEFERPEFGGRVGSAGSSSADTDLLEGIVWERERPKRGLVGCTCRCDGFMVAVEAASNIQACEAGSGEWLTRSPTAESRLLWHKRLGVWQYEKTVKNAVEIRPFRMKHAWQAPECTSRECR